MSVILHPDGLLRCSWAGHDSTYIDYHDQEWGRPVRDQRELFEHLSLEGFQAGLSWITILKRREGFRAAFEGFDIQKVACFDESRIQSLRRNPSIIRNELKIRAVVHNARLVIEESVDLRSVFWEYAPEQPLTPEEDFAWRVTSPESDALSKRLKKIGFKFVGSTSMYAMMQAAGMIRDHEPRCYRRAQDRLELEEIA